MIKIPTRPVLTFVFTIIATVAPGFSTHGAIFADHKYIPPASAAALKSSLHPIAQHKLSEVLSDGRPVHVFHTFAGLNDALRAEEHEDKVLHVGAGYPIDLNASSLFGSPLQDGADTTYSCDITSTDAKALRFLVDLSYLREGEELYVVDLKGPRAFGPYGRDDHVEGGRWLPTTEGDTAALLLRTSFDDMPDLQLLGLSHFYSGFAELKELSCNNNIACESNSAIQDLSLAVGLIVLPSGSFDAALCSGTLIENPDTALQEPYFITADHCDIPRFHAPAQIDVIWDFRVGDCPGLMSPPLLSSLPRSTGMSVLGTSDVYDATLLELDTVPVGAMGRTYIGWDLRDPVINENVFGIHHPQGTHMRISYGHIEAIDQFQPVFDYHNQTKVKWDDGVTEGGSSGSCLVFNNGSLRITGMLSNGTLHNCVDTSGNHDLYASFRDFFPTVEMFLTGGAPLEGAGEGGGEGVTEGVGSMEGDGDVNDKVPGCGVASLAGQARGNRALGDAVSIAAVLVILVTARRRRHQKTVS